MPDGVAVAFRICLLALVVCCFPFSFLIHTQSHASPSTSYKLLGRRLVSPSAYIVIVLQVSSIYLPLRQLSLVKPARSLCRTSGDPLGSCLDTCGDLLGASSTTAVIRWGSLLVVIRRFSRLAVIRLLQLLRQQRRGSPSCYCRCRSLVTG